MTASGVGAISQTLLALTRQHDHVICFVETYNPTRYLIRRLLGRFGVAHTLLSIEDLAGVERALAAQPTRLVLFESPTNPVTKIADIAALTRLARAAGALTVMDNTFAGFHQHGDYEVDVFVHSLTKYASGTGDVMGGAVIASRELIKAMRTDFSALGGTLDPHAAFLILRGLKTYFVRYQAQSASAARIAQWLAQQPGGGARALPRAARTSAACAGCAPDAGLRHHRQLRSAGATRTPRDAVSDALQLFALTASLGSTESLAVTAQMMGARELSAEQQRMSARHGRDHPPVDRPGRRRRPHRGSGSRP